MTKTGLMKFVMYTDLRYFLAMTIWALMIPVKCLPVDLGNNWSAISNWDNYLTIAANWRAFWQDWNGNCISAQGEPSATFIWSYVVTRCTCRETYSSQLLHWAEKADTTLCSQVQCWQFSDSEAKSRGAETCTACGKAEVAWLRAVTMHLRFFQHL